MAGRGAGASKVRTIGDYVQDPHVTCLDTFSLTPVPVAHSPGPLESFCQVPSDNPHREGAPTVTLAPGLEVFDFYASSEKTEVWKDNASLHDVLVPHTLVGWEFYTLLYPRPDGSAPVTINPDSSGPGIELLFGRPPGAQQCPSVLFIIVPEGQQYQVPTPSGQHQGRPHPKSGRARGAASKTPYSCEKAADNLDAKGVSLHKRLLALCPAGLYDETAVLPDGSGWGLFIGPRHRLLVLLNRKRGRIDVQLAMLFSIDAVFQQGQSLIDGTARLFASFGTAEAAAALFKDFDPLKAHCGFTNAVIADHINASIDGRDDYRRLLGVWPQSFFVSNNSDNLRFLTPLEVQHHRSAAGSGRRDETELPAALRLEDFPKWVITHGEFDHEDRKLLRRYRTHIIPYATKAQSEPWRGGVLSFLGLHTSSNAKADDTWSNMVTKLGGCAEVTFAGTQPWQEPGAVIDARPAVSTGGEKAPEPAPEPVAAPVAGWFGQEPFSSTGRGAQVNWRHSMDLVPGGIDDGAVGEGESPREEEHEQKGNQQPVSRAPSKEEQPADVIEPGGQGAGRRRFSVMPEASEAILPPPV